MTEAYYSFVERGKGFAYSLDSYTLHVDDDGLHMSGDGEDQFGDKYKISYTKLQSSDGSDGS